MCRFGENPTATRSLTGRAGRRIGCLSGTTFRSRFAALIGPLGPRPRLPARPLSVNNQGGEQGRFTSQRAEMTQSDLRRRGITNEAVLAAMSSVPREQFVPRDITNFAYDDRPLPIGEGQTISQPYVVALMAQASHITASSRVLEIGTGSGYGAAILSYIAEVVVSVERHETLANTAREALTAAGFENVTVIHGDGSLGYPEAAPYDAIVVTAGGPKVPKPLLDQLADGGFLVMPVGPDNKSQSLLQINRAGSELHEQNLGRVRFVPLIGAEA